MSKTDRVHLDQKGRLVIGDHAEVVRLAHDPETFSSIVSRHLQVPNGLDGAAHAEMRHLLDPFMDADAVAQLLPELERIAADLVARLDAADAPFGAVADLGARFAVRAQSAWLGWLPEWEEPLLQWVADNRVASRTGHPRATAEIADRFDRTDVVDIVRRLAAISGPHGPVAIAMTTNGIRLADMLPDLAAAGLDRLNISIDTLDRERFRELTRRDRLEDVRAGIAAAAASGLRPLKLNAVAMRGVNDDELVDLVEFALAHGAQMRFIEQMPLDAGHTWDRRQMVTRDEILTALRARWDLEPVPGRGGAPAERFLLDGGPASVGVIASVTAPFCGDCDRLRLTADGQLRNCLFSLDEHDLLPVLRAGVDDVAVDRMLRGCVAGKLPGHAIDDPSFLQPARGMNAIGG